MQAVDKPARIIDSWSRRHHRPARATRGPLRRGAGGTANVDDSEVMAALRNALRAELARDNANADDRELIGRFLSNLPPDRTQLDQAERLLPKRVRAGLPTTNSKNDDGRRRIRLYAPWIGGSHGGWIWYVTAVDRDNDDILYCRVEGLFNESGVVSLGQIASLRGPRGERVKCDRSFKSQDPDFDMDSLLGVPEPRDAGSGRPGLA